MAEELTQVEEPSLVSEAVETVATAARPAFRWVGAAPFPAVLTGKDATDSFYGQALHMVCRLRDHIERLDAGVVYAVDDIAVVLRAMLHRGKGNRVLQRLHETIKAAPLEILLSKTPAQDKEVVFSLGAVPVTTETALAHGARWVKLTDWVTTPVLTVRSNETVETLTWSDFLNKYANKWGGAHLDQSIPNTLQLVDRFDVGGFALSGYLLRGAAVQTWLIGQALLQEWNRATPAIRDVRPDGSTGTEVIRTAAPGGISDDPMEIRDRGELHYFAHERGGSAEMIAFSQPNTVSGMTLAFGAYRYNVTIRPEGSDATTQPTMVSQPRTPVEKPSLVTELTSAKTARLQGRFLTFPPDEPKFC